MYNRYIPKNDGSYHRRAVPDQSQKPIPNPPPPDETPDDPQPQKPVSHGSSIGFLKSLLPKSFDTGDLIVVLLLLLIAGDCREEQNTALLTLALYFFL